MLTAKELFEHKLKENDYKITTPRAMVFEFLLESEHEPLTMAQLVKNMNSYGERTSVYRAVKTLEQIGVVKRLNVGWKYKLELSDEFHGHHHHITCEKCGQTVATHSDTLEKMVAKIAQNNGYKITDHMLDIRGLCKKCQIL